MASCKICGQQDCKKHSFLIGKSITTSKISGSSPPEIFVGKYGYPEVYAGILAPQEYGDTLAFSSPEHWHAQKMSIPRILSLRERMIYGRTKTSIKKQKYEKHILPVVQEVAMTHKSIATEMHFKKPIRKNDDFDPRVPLISNAAQITSARLQENTLVKPKVDYLVNDIDVKSSTALVELQNSQVDTSSIIKLLSAGLLGIKANRKLVPTRWAITAVDDTLSKDKLKEIRLNKEITNIEVFHAEYIGNHYEFLLLPEKWSFEVIEISTKNFGVWQDYESFFPRKTYADDVTGAYYANRLAVTEYLQKLKKQACVIVFRQISHEYSSPLGVGILRQVSREAFARPSTKFSTIKEALTSIQSRLNISVDNYASRSYLLQNFGRQKKISQFF